MTAAYRTFVTSFFRGSPRLHLSSSAVPSSLSCPRGPRRATVSAVFAAVLLLITTPSSAQTTADREAANGLSNPMEALRSRLSGSAGASAPLEGPVDPSTYRVGPGDLFTITVGTGEGTAASVPVSADGLLLLPEAGSVQVAGLTLAAARDTALVQLRRSFGRLRVDIALAQPRSFYVHVSGAVPVPGRYVAAPVSRVSSVLEIAFADTSRAPVSNPSYRPSLRNVSLISRDGAERSLDLARYFSTGDVAHNPYLTDGDVIVVAGYDPAYESVQVDGAVPFPGSYDVRKGDTVRDLLQVAGLTRAPAHASAVRITRYAADGLHSEEILTSAVFENESGDSPIGARDHIAVVADRPPGGTASIEGWVRSPGDYAIEGDTTTVADLIQRAGGLREGALLTAAYIERGGDVSRARRFAGATADPGRAGAESHPDLARLLRADTLEAGRRMRLTDLELSSRVYFAQEYEATRRVSVDLQAMLGGGVAPIVLEDGDRLVIPRDESTVHVFGQVVRPGYVPFTAGKARDWFIQAAGGTSANAGRVLHLRASTGQVETDPAAPVRSGDLVFVDRATVIAESFAARQIDVAELELGVTREQLDLSRRQLDLQERMQRREQRVRIFQTLLGTISTVATVVVLFRSIDQQP